MCVAKDENPTLNERKNILLQEAAKPTTELDFPSVTVCSPRLNMKAVKEVIFEDFNYYFNNPGDGLAAEHRRRNQGRSSVAYLIFVTSPRARLV